MTEFLKSFGPAWIVMIADVDAASILTAAEDGAVYGYGLIWFLLLLVIPLFVIQEAAGRIGVATHKGLGVVIRENYSRRTAVLMSLPMAVVDVVSYVVEFAGIAVGMEIFGIPAFVSLPVVYLLHLVVVLRQKYVTAEKVLFVVSVVLILSYAGSLLARGVVASSVFYFSTDAQFLYLLAASAGAVVMPFMLFYQVSATAEKKVGALWASRLETLLGAIASEIGMVVILMASYGLSPSLNLTSPSYLAAGLSAVAGSYAPQLFGAGLVAASFLALVVISLASAWAITEALGWGRESFSRIYILESLPALAVPMLFSDLFALLLNLMVVFVFVLIGPGLIMGLIASNKRIMGSHSSTRWWKIAYWLSMALVVSLGFAALTVLF